LVLATEDAHPRERLDKPDFPQIQSSLNCRSLELGVWSSLDNGVLALGVWSLCNNHLDELRKYFLSFDEKPVGQVFRSGIFKPLNFIQKSMIDLFEERLQSLRNFIVINHPSNFGVQLTLKSQADFETMTMHRATGVAFWQKRQVSGRLYSKMLDEFKFSRHKSSYETIFNNNSASL
jgi:hypothetical protein